MNADKPQPSIDPAKEMTVDEILSNCWCDDHRCSKVLDLQAEAKAQLQELIEYVIGKPIDFAAEMESTEFDFQKLVAVSFTAKAVYERLAEQRERLNKIMKG